MTSVSFVSSSKFTLGTEIDGGSLRIPSSATSGHDIYIPITSHGHNSGIAYPVVVDNDTGGNTFALIGTADSRIGTLWHKKATLDTGSKIVTITGCREGAAAALSVYSGGFPGDPTTNWATRKSLVTDNSIASFVPSYASSRICLVVFNQDDVSCSTLSTDHGLMSIEAQMLSTGDTDAGVVIGSSFQSSAVSSTGSGFWTQVSKTKRSMFWAIRPSVITSVSTSEPTSTVTVPIHTYLNAGTYVVKLTVTDNDGNSSSTTKAVTVS